MLNCFQPDTRQVNHSCLKVVYNLQEFPPFILEISQQISKTLWGEMNYFSFGVLAAGRQISERNGTYLLFVGGRDQCVLSIFFHSKLKKDLKIITKANVTSD